jgi:hypothetical protein
MGNSELRWVLLSAGSSMPSLPPCNSDATKKGAGVNTTGATITAVGLPHRAVGTSKIAVLLIGTSSSSQMLVWVDDTFACNHWGINAIIFPLPQQPHGGGQQMSATTTAVYRAPAHPPGQERLQRWTPAGHTEGWMALLPTFIKASMPPYPPHHEAPVGRGQPPFYHNGSAPCT